MLSSSCGLHLTEYVQNCRFVSLNRSTKSRCGYRIWFQWRLKEVVCLSRNRYATLLETNWVTYLHGCSCSLGERWVFYVKDNLAMLVINMLNRLLVYTLRAIWVRFFLLAQDEFHQTIQTKSSFSPMFIYCSTRLIFVWIVRFLPCLKLLQRKKNISEMSNAVVWLAE